MSKNTFLIRRMEWVPVEYEYTVKAETLKDAVEKLESDDQETLDTRYRLSVNNDAEPTEVDERQYWKAETENGTFEMLGYHSGFQNMEAKADPSVIHECPEHLTYMFSVVKDNSRSSSPIERGNYDFVSECIKEYLSSLESSDLPEDLEAALERIKALKPGEEDWNGRITVCCLFVVY